jgi:hypothetical protein
MTGSIRNYYLREVLIFTCLAVLFIFININYVNAVEHNSFVIGKFFIKELSKTKIKKDNWIRVSNHFKFGATVENYFLWYNFTSNQDCLLAVKEVSKKGIFNQDFSQFIVTTPLVIHQGPSSFSLM